MGILDRGVIRPVNVRPFSTRDYVFAAMIAGGQFAISSVTIPLTFALTLFGVNVIVYAPLASMLLVVGLVRLRRPGSLLLISSIYALLALPISIVIVAFVLASALVAEAAGTFLFRGYRSATAQITAATINCMAMLPASFAVSLWLMPADYIQRNMRAGLIAWAVAQALILVGSVAGGLVGTVVARELAKAGKLRVEEDG